MQRYRFEHTNLPTTSDVVSRKCNGSRATDTDRRLCDALTSKSQFRVHRVNASLAGCSSEPIKTAHSNGCTKGYEDRNRESQSYMLIKNKKDFFSFTI